MTNYPPNPGSPYQQPQQPQQPPQQPWNAPPQQWNTPQQPQQWQPNPQQQWGAPTPPRRTPKWPFVLVGVLLVVVLVVSLGVNALWNAMTSSLTDDIEVSEGTLPDPYDDPEIIPDDTEIDPIPEDTTPVSTVESDWYNHKNTLAIPADSTNYPKTAFRSDYPDATDWLNSFWEQADTHPVRVVWSSDPAVNCGIKLMLDKGESMNNIVGGCYRPEYGRVIFIFWGNNVPQYIKEFVVNHEYSHFITTFLYFDATHSASVSSDYWQSSQGSADFEQDATCRQNKKWDWQTPDGFSSPCTTSNWTEGWILERIKNYGVTVEDY